MQKKKWGKKCVEICAIKGAGVRRLIAIAILNFHFFGTLPLAAGRYQDTLLTLGQLLLFRLKRAIKVQGLQGIQIFQYLSTFRLLF